MRSKTPRDLAFHCPRCFLKDAICVCGILPRVETRTRIVIIRHVTELWLTSNTGRLAALALPNAEIREYGGGASFDDESLLGPRSVLLYSSGTRGASRLPPFEPERLIVLDGSFRQARRMYKRIESLRQLPELSLSPPANPPLRLRMPPHPDGLSTLEAIAHALALLEGAARAEPLFALQAEFVRRMDALRGRLRDALGRGIN